MHHKHMAAGLSCALFSRWPTIIPSLRNSPSDSPTQKAISTIAQQENTLVEQFSVLYVQHLKISGALNKLAKLGRQVAPRPDSGKRPKGNLSSRFVWRVEALKYRTPRRSDDWPAAEPKCCIVYRRG